MKNPGYKRIFAAALAFLFLTGAAQPVRAEEKHLVFGQTQTYNSLEPCHEYDGWMLERAGVGETLTRLDDSLQAEGWLAEDDYSVSEDGLTWTFTIRDGVTFSNGNPLTAQAAADAIQYAFDNSVRSMDFFELDSLTADGRTLRIKTKVPAPTLPGMLADPFFIIFDTSEDLTNIADLGPACTGPFLVESNDQLSMTLELVKNENYWGGEVKLDSVEFLQFQDTSTMNMAFEAGQLDVCYGLSPIDGASYLDDDSYDVEMCTGLRTDWGLFNQNGLLADKALRTALLQCLDMETICEIQLNGMFVAGNTPFASEALGVNDLTNPYPFDMEAAAETLQEAGYQDTDGDGMLETPDGEKLTLKVLSYTTRAELPIICEALQLSAATLGISIEIQYVQDLWAQAIKTGDFDICVFNCSGFSSGDPEAFLKQYFQTGAVYNTYGYSNTEVDTLIDSLSDIFDSEERIHIEREISQQLMDDACCAFYSYPTVFIVSRSSVTGIKCTPADYYWLTAETDIS